jgi:hypothetical protein
VYKHILRQSHHFIAQGAVDPILKDKLEPGDEIVVCACHGSAFLVSSWTEFAYKSHGGIDNTLQNINNGPTSGNLKFGKTKSSYSPPRGVHRPTTQRVEHEGSKAGSWVIAILVLIVIGVLWFQYKQDKEPASKPKASPIPQVQFGEKPKIERKLKAQSSEPTHQDPVASSVLQTESISQDTTLENIEKIEFKIYSDPDGAQVYFDEKLVGITPVTLKALPGKYRLRIVKDGYRPQGTTVRISSTSKTEFFNTLSEEK